MTVYEHRAVVTVSGGSTGTTTLSVQGGLLQNVLIRALTTPATTYFRADLTDSNNIQRVNWGYHTGEINDHGISFPMVGTYTLNITNASAVDTFRIILGVRE